MPLRSGIIGLMLLSACSCMAGTIYQWVDAQGVPHFSDSAPNNAAGKDVQKLEIHAAPSSDASSEIKQLNKEQDQQAQADSKDAARAAAAAKAKARADAAAKDNIERCRQLREDLTVMNEHGRVREMDPKTGQAVILSEDDKEARMKEIQKQISAFCSS